MHNVGRITAAGKNNQQIPQMSINGQLLGEYPFVADVVRQAGHHRRIRREGLYFHSSAGFSCDAEEEIIGQVDRVARTASVSAQKYLLPASPAVQHVVGK